MGPRSMVKPPSNVTASQITDMKKIWRRQFNGAKRTMRALKELIHNNKDDVGPDFLRNMYVYIISGVIWSGGSDIVYDDSLPYLQEVDKVDQLNWCEYVIDKLIESKLKWKMGKPFCGPILFLVVSILLL